MTSALAVRQLCVWHGRAQAVFGIDLEIGPGERVGLLGRNGAGKTSTIMAIVGVDVKSTGQVELFGEKCSRKRADQRARLGLAWIPDSRRILSKLTVRENLELARSGSSGSQRKGLGLSAVLDSFPILVPLLEKKGLELSGGEQQIVAIARAIVASPRLTLIDEPTEGLSPKIVSQVKGALSELQRRGTAYLLVEQDLQFATQMTDRVYVMDRGRIVNESSSSELSNNKQLQRELLTTLKNDSPEVTEQRIISPAPGKEEGSG